MNPETRWSVKEAVVELTNNAQQQLGPFNFIPTKGPTFLGKILPLAKGEVIGQIGPDLSRVRRVVFEIEVFHPDEELPRRARLTFADVNQLLK